MINTGSSDVDFIIVFIVLILLLIYQAVLAISLYEHAYFSEYKDSNRKRYIRVLIILLILNGPVVWTLILLYNLIEVLFTTIYKTIHYLIK